MSFDVRPGRGRSIPIRAEPPAGTRPSSPSTPPTVAVRCRSISGWWQDVDSSVRALAVLPGTDRGAAHDRITAWRRAAGGSFVGTDYALAPGTIRSRTIAAIAAGVSSPEVVAESPAPREILVCGHGRRDRCCGSLGVRLQAQMIGQLSGVRVRRCSHLGGHRFAPTAITFPDGHWWAYLDPGSVDRIVNGDIDADLLARHCRGRGGLGAAAQLVERQLLAEHGPAWNEVDIDTVATDGGLDDLGTTIVTMAWHEWEPRDDGSSVPRPISAAGRVWQRRPDHQDNGHRAAAGLAAHRSASRPRFDEKTILSTLNVKERTCDRSGER
jgi:(2Fe-2S) ferredoxin